MRRTHPTTALRALRALALAAFLPLAAGCDSFATAPADLARSNTPPPSSSLTVVNNTTRTINTVRLAPCSTGTYGASLGSVSSFARQSWPVEPGCYDIAVTLSSGTASPHRANIGANTDYELTYQ